MGTILFLKKTWINNIIESILNIFNKIGKGWFNIKEKNRDSFEFGKFKKFLNLVRLMM